MDEKKAEDAVIKLGHRRKAPHCHNGRNATKGTAAKGSRERIGKAKDMHEHCTRHNSQAETARVKLKTAQCPRLAQRFEEFTEERNQRLLIPAPWHHRLKGKPGSSNDRCRAHMMDCHVNETIPVQAEPETALAVSSNTSTTCDHEDKATLQQGRKYGSLRKGKATRKNTVKVPTSRC